MLAVRDRLNPTAARGGRPIQTIRRMALGRMGRSPALGYDDADIVTDFGDHTSNLEIADGLMHAFRRGVEARRLGLAIPGFPWDETRRLGRNRALHPPRNVSDIPPRNIDYAALSLVRLAQDGKVIAHVTDPRVGNSNQAGEHQRSMLVTENHGVLVGPNNGSLGVLARVLDERGSATRCSRSIWTRFSAFTSWWGAGS